MKHKTTRFVYITEAILVLVFAGLWLWTRDANIETTTRLESCRSLAKDLDTLLYETDQDRQTYAVAVSEVLNDQISVDKFGAIIDELVPRVDQRQYRYDNLLDKYNGLCFEL